MLESIVNKRFVSLNKTGELLSNYQLITKSNTNKLILNLVKKTKKSSTGSELFSL